MFLKSIEIENYKRIKKAKINLENDLTLFAGANNSGKTSIIDLLKRIFNEGVEKVESSDINAIDLKKWIDEFYLFFEELLKKEYNSDILLIQDLENFFVEKYVDNTLKLPEVNLEVNYLESDDLSKFILYLCDLNDSLKSIFFKYRLEINISLFKKKLIEKYKYMKKRYRSKEENSKVKQENSIKNILIELYLESAEEKYYYTNSSYQNLFGIKTKEFKKLFNFSVIYALRTLDDHKKDSNNSLSKSMVDIASLNDEWIELMNDLSDEIIRNVEFSKIEENISNDTSKNFNETMEDIKLTSGNNDYGKLELTIETNSNSVNNLIRNTTSARYNIGDIYLDEYSQGLGYSNMVYIHLKQKIFEKKIDKSVINIFVIEEPEAHMHPQMQKSFFKYLLKFYGANDAQCIITTHSSEIVRNIDNMQKLRVVRNNGDKFSSSVYDFSQFINQITDKKFDDGINKIDFYNYFFTVGFPDLIFADRIIMFEGDTERMYLKAIIKDNFPLLDKSYISYIQVGGAYAKNYYDILDFLNIKSLIITDLDYKKDLVNKEEILNSDTTNATIKFFYNMIETDDKSTTISNIYEWIDKQQENSVINIYTQTANDSYSRTLEEAMLLKYLNLKIWDKKDREYWKKVREDNKIIFSIPNSMEEISVRDIINSSSSNKTDFMYSVILNNLYEKMLPDYICRGLSWLEK